MMIAMALSLAGEEGETILRDAIVRAPSVAENPDIAALASAVEDGGYDFFW
jgi:hypothetical protein